jgi:hypothetical protein
MGKSGIFFPYYTAMVTGGEAVQATSVKNEQRKGKKEGNGKTIHTAHIFFKRQGK